MTALALQRAAIARPGSWLAAALAVVIALQLELVFNRPINWDEFHHLAQTHAFVEGRLAEAMQVFYARAFFWIALLPLELVDQVRVARVFMLACELFTAYAVYAVARRFSDHVPAAIAALAYLTAGYVFQHGFSYRADPLAAAMLMGALWLIAASPLARVNLIAVAFLAALAWLTTIKMVLYAPAFAGIAWWRWQSADRSPALLKRFALCAALATVLAAAFTLITIATLPPDGAGTAQRTMSSSASRMFSEGLFPQWRYALGAAASAPLAAVMVAIAPFAAVRARLPRPELAALAGLILPLASIALYRNSFPYFYAFILPPAMVAAAIAARLLLAHVSERLVLIALVLNAGFATMATPRDVLASQQQVIDAVRLIFPQPVPYFDFPGLVSNFPKANFFMSTWGMTRYRNGGSRTFVEAMTEETVPLLIIDHHVLERNQLGTEPAPELLARDAAALRENFVPHWGPLWVAGRRFAETDEAAEFAIYAAGTYTLEGAAARIDGQVLEPGDAIRLAKGAHRFGRLGRGEIVLRWGDRLARPADPYRGGPVFRDF